MKAVFGYATFGITFIGALRASTSLMSMTWHTIGIVYITEALQVSADVLLRTNIPEVNGIYQGEFKDLLADCSPAEIDSILKIVKELKTTMRIKKDDYLF